MSFPNTYIQFFWLNAKEKSSGCITDEVLLNDLTFSALGKDKQTVAAAKRKRKGDLRRQSDTSDRTFKKVLKKSFLSSFPSSSWSVGSWDSSSCFNCPIFFTDKKAIVATVEATHFVDLSDFHITFSHPRNKLFKLGVKCYYFRMFSHLHKM